MIIIQKVDAGGVSLPDQTNQDDWEIEEVQNKIYEKIQRKAYLQGFEDGKNFEKRNK